MTAPRRDPRRPPCGPPAGGAATCRCSARCGCATTACSPPARSSASPAPGRSASRRTGSCCSCPATAASRSASSRACSSCRCCCSGCTAGCWPTATTSAPLLVAVQVVMGVLALALGAARRHRGRSSCGTSTRCLRARRRLRRRRPGAPGVRRRARRARRPAQRGRASTAPSSTPPASSGPALAGLVIAAAGTGWVFLGNAVSYVAVVAGPGRSCAPTSCTRPRASPGPAGQVREGLRYVRRSPDLLVTDRARRRHRDVRPELPGHARAARQAGLRPGARRRSACSAACSPSARCSARSPAPAAAGRRGCAGCCSAALRLRPARGRSSAWRRPTRCWRVLLVPTGFAVLTFTTTANTLVQLGSAAARARPGDGAVRPRLPRRHAVRRAGHRRRCRGPRPALGPARSAAA